MEMHFDNEYIVMVLVFLCVLVCCRPILESVVWWAQMLRGCSGTCVPCFFLECGSLSCVSAAVRFAVLVMAMSQPAWLALSLPLHSALTGHYPRPTVTLFSVDAAARNISTGETGTVMLEIHAVHSEYMFFALPYTCVSALGLFIWLHKRDAKHISVWEVALFEDPDICLYEFAYFAEIFLMNHAALLATARSIEYSGLLYLSLSLSALVFVFVNSAKFPAPTGPDRLAGMLLFAGLATILCHFWLTAADLACTACVAVGCVHTAVVVAVCVFHSLCQAEAATMAVIVFRATCSVCLTVALTVYVSLA